MNKIAFHCECGERLVVSSEQAASGVTCPQCKKVAEVPGYSGRIKKSATDRINKSAIAGTERKSKTTVVTTVVATQSNHHKPATSRHKAAPTARRTREGLQPPVIAALAAGGALFLGVILFAAVGGGRSGGKDGGKTQAAAASDQEIADWVNGLSDRRQAYEKAAQEEDLRPGGAGEPGEMRRKVAGEVRQAAREKFSAVPAARVDAAVDRALETWDRKLGAGKPPEIARKDPEPPAPKREPRGPTLEELKLYLDTLPKKREYMDACGKAFSFQAEDTKRWWRGEAERAANEMKNDVRLRYKDVDTKALFANVEKVLEEWRQEAEKSSPQVEPPRQPEPPRPEPPRPEPPRQKSQMEQLQELMRDPRTQRLVGPVAEFLDKQPDLKTELKALVAKHGLNPSSGNPEIAAWAQKLHGRLRTQFPNEEPRFLQAAAVPKINAWAIGQ